MADALYSYAPPNDADSDKGTQIKTWYYFVTYMLIFACKRFGHDVKLVFCTFLSRCCFLRYLLQTKEVSFLRNMPDKVSPTNK